MNGVCERKGGNMCPRCYENNYQPEGGLCIKCIKDDKKPKRQKKHDIHTECLEIIKILKEFNKSQK